MIPVWKIIPGYIPIIQEPVEPGRWIGSDPEGIEVEDGLVVHLVVGDFDISSVIDTVHGKVDVREVDGAAKKVGMTGSGSEPHIRSQRTNGDGRTIVITVDSSQAWIVEDH